MAPFTLITDGPEAVHKELAKQWNLAPAEVANCLVFLIGSPVEIREQLKQRREDLGINCIVILVRTPELVEQFAESVVRPLSKL